MDQVGCSDPVRIIVDYLETETAISFRRRNGNVQGGLQKNAVAAPDTRHFVFRIAVISSVVRADTAASLVDPENCKTAAVIGSSSVSLTLGSDGSGRLLSNDSMA